MPREVLEANLKIGSAPAKNASAFAEMLFREYGLDESRRADVRLETVSDTSTRVRVMNRLGSPWLEGWFSSELQTDTPGVEDPAIIVRHSTSDNCVRVLARNYADSGFGLIEDLPHMSGLDPFPAVAVAQLNVGAEDLLFKVHDSFRDSDGLHNEDAIDELCKVLALKFLDEGRTVDLFSTASVSCPDEFCSVARALYDRNAAGMAFGTPEPIKLSSAALLKALRHLAPYDLSASETDIKGRALQRVLAPAARSGMGQFLTPGEVVDFIVATIAPTPLERVLDPFCGSAHFLTATLRLASASGNLASDYAARHLFGIEKSRRMVRVASVDLAMAGDGHSNVLESDSLLPFDNYPHDFAPACFDVVMTNPPFGCLLNDDAMNRLGRFELANGSSNGLPLEVIGLERAIQFLRPGGWLGIVVPEGILTNARAQRVRAWLLRNCNLAGMVSLPVDTFMPFGASVRTAVLFARKKDTAEASNDDGRTFVARVDSVGYDGSGRAKGENELTGLAHDMRRFFLESGWRQ